MKFRFLLLLFVFIPVMLFGAKSSYNYRDDELRSIARTVVRDLERRHYSAIPLERMTEKFFVNYLDSLDPAHVFLTQDDVADMRNRYGNKLVDILRNGNLDFCFESAKLFRKRIMAFRSFAEQNIGALDFSTDDEIEIDRTKSPRPVNDAEMMKLWEKRLKNDVLYFKMLDYAMKEEGKEKEQREDARIPQGTPEERVMKRLRDLGNEISKRERIDTLCVYLDALAKTYGPHSGYNSPSREEDFDITMRLSLTGIGATLTSDGGFVKIVEIVPGSPVDKDGRLKVGDRITAVQQETQSEPVDIIDMPLTKAVRLIRGPIGTKVTLTVLHGNKQTPDKVTLVRDKILIKDGEAKGEIRQVTIGEREIKVGVLTLPGFYLDFEAMRKRNRNAKSCSNDCLKILKDFNRQQVDSVIVDLRKNAGGSLIEAIRLVDFFVEREPVVQVRNRDREIDVCKTNDSRIVYSGPLVILTSKLSASASEIFSSALRDMDRALLVGDTRTFGKGTILEVMDVDPLGKLFLKSDFPGGALTCETQMFFRPNGASVQQLGIASDIVLPSITEELKYGEMELKNHLPWDKIPATTRNGYCPYLKYLIPVLTEHSKARVASDKDYQQLIKDAELVRKNANVKFASLNERKRMDEYKREHVADERTKAELEERESNKKNAPDPILNEGVMIAADFMVELEKIKNDDSKFEE